MTDLELTKACAEAMGFTIFEEHEHNGLWCHGPDRSQHGFWYHPLHDDAQALALGKTHPEEFEAAVLDWTSAKRRGENPDLNRILCGNVARK